MKGDAFQIERLRVERLYGIRHDGVAAEDLSWGVNVIYGTNGRGKTTFGRAVQGLIWPKFLTDWRPTVSGAFTYGGARWTIDLEDGRLRYQRNGADSQPSALPDESHRERYWLSLHELIDRDRGRSFAEQIRDLALGGQNVEEAARQLAFSKPSGRKTATTDRLAEATLRLEKVRGQQEDLRRRERSLNDLERQRDEARDAARRGDLIQRIIELNRARQAARAARAALEELPEILANVREDDAERIEKCLQDEQTALRHRHEAASRRDAARDGLTQNLIARSGRPEVNLADLQDRQRKLVDLERELRQTRQDIAKAEAEIDEAWRAISADGDQEPAGSVSSETLKAIDTLVAERDALRQKQEAQKSLAAVLGDEQVADLEEAYERLFEGIRTLGDWMREAGAADAQSPQIFPLAAGSAALLFFAGLLATLLWHPAAILGLVAGLVLAVIAAMARRRGGTDPRVHEERFVALSLDRPASWTIPEVRNHQRGLEAKRADVAVRLEKARRREAASPRREELDEQQQALDERAAAIALELGLEAPTTGIALITFARNLDAWQSCRRERAGLSARGTELQKQLRAELDAFNQAVRDLSLPAASDASGTTGIVDTIDRAQQNLVSLDQELRSAERDLEAADERASTARSSIRSICERLSIDEEGAHHEAKNLCDQLDEYRQRSRASGEKSAIADRMGEEVAAHPAFSPELLEEDEVALDRLLGRAREQADVLNHVVEEIGAIRGEVQRAQQEHDLERALAEQEEAVEALRREYEAACAQAIGRLLADHVEEDSRETQLPPVFHRAKELFAAFTRSRYELRFDRRDASFRGFDTVLDRGFELDELSSGTRLQLLLAVRIAFVEQLEQGCRLPILLDEALANSDDDRADAIIEAVLELCRRGRQVFYFTAQDDEVLKWKRALSEHADIERTFIALPGGDGAAEVDERELPAAPIMRALPPMDGHSHRAYGRLLNVPRWSGWEDVGALHVWYLEPRLEKIRSLLAKGFERWGQLNSLLRHEAIEAAGYDEAGIRPLVAKARALEVWQELWRIGRGKPVDREVLAASKAVTDSFIDRVHERCVAVGGDGRELMMSLYDDPIPRYVSQREALEEYLLAGGYIEETAPMHPDDIRIEVLGRMKKDLDAAGLTADDLAAFLEDVRRGPEG